MGTKENKAVVLALYDRMNARQYDDMWELFTPDAKWGGGRHSSDEFAGIDRMKVVFVDPMPAFTDGGIAFTVHALTAEGDRVAAEVESYAPTTAGKLYNNHYHMLFELRDGRIAVVKEYADTAHAREVFGDLDLG
jgi:ketosteroid isomerase-like protein